jgi:bifunctional protein rfaE, domain II
MPPIDKLLENIMSEWPLPAFEQKICPPEELAARLAALPRPLVFTNGCFDILHRGHVTYLAQAKATGAFLILALNTDASVRRLGKGDNRPVNPLENRAAVAAALESVDLVTWFDEDTPAELIELVKPDILVKGGDWAADKIVGAKETLARGGKVYSIPFLHQTSTTKTLAKIRAGEAAEK